MLKYTCAVASTAFLLALAPLAVDAQPTSRPVARQPAPRKTPPTLPSRIFVDVNGGMQSGARTFSDSRNDPFSAETASWTADYETRSAPAFDVSGGVRLWRNLVASVSYSRVTDTSVAAIQGEVPHPFFFNKNRAISGETLGLKQQEDVIHVSASWAFPVSRRLDVRVFAGPSLYGIQRDLVADVGHVEDGYPYDTASFGTATVERAKVNALGVNVGGDVTWMFTRTVGVGAIARFSRADSNIASPANANSLALSFGGLQFGGGLRLRFGQAATRTGTPAPRRGRSQAPPTAPAPPKSPPTATEPVNTVPRRDSRPASAGPAVGSTVTIRKDSPVFVRPEALMPLRTLAAGTRVTVREQVGEWLMIEFRGAQSSVRVGYVRRDNCEW